MLADPLWTALVSPRPIQCLSIGEKATEVT